MSFSVESLQQTALGTVRDTPVGGSDIRSAFENLGVNLAGSLAAIGVTKLQEVSGISQRQTASSRTSLLSPVAPSPVVRPQTNWGAFALVLVGFAALAGLVVYAHRPVR